MASSLVNIDLTTVGLTSTSHAKINRVSYFAILMDISRNLTNPITSQSKAPDLGGTCGEIDRYCRLASKPRAKADRTTAIPCFENHWVDAVPLPPSPSGVGERLSRNPIRTFDDHAGGWSEIVWLSGGRATIGGFAECLISAIRLLKPRVVVNTDARKSCRFGNGRPRGGAKGCVHALRMSTLLPAVGQQSQ